jgi:hypothetical protein
MSKRTATFVKMQIMQSGNYRTKKRFTFRQKILALSLYQNSPSAYKLLTEVCILPDIDTLANLVQKVTLKPSINNTIFEKLRKRVQKMPEAHKYCALTFYEMKIPVNVAHQRAIAYIDDCVLKTPQLVDHVLIFSVRGIVKRYKKPVHFTFCAGNTKTLHLKNMILKVIRRLQECGFNIVATICDPRETNVDAINLLLKDSRELFITKREEYPEGVLLIGNKQIYTLYDPPEFNGFRNNLSNNDLRYAIRSKKFSVKWDRLIKLQRRKRTHVVKFTR